MKQTLSECNIRRRYKRSNTPLPEYQPGIHKGVDFDATKEPYYSITAPLLNPQHLPAG